MIYPTAAKLHRLAATLVAFCYLLLAGFDTVHEVIHLHVPAATGAMDPAADLPGDLNGANNAAERSCFFCVTGHPHALSSAIAAYGPVRSADAVFSVIPTPPSSACDLPAVPRGPPVSC